MAHIENGKNDMASWGRQMRQFVAEGEELRDSECHTLNPIYRCHPYMFIYIYMYTNICTYMDLHILCMYVLYYDSLIYSLVAEHKFELFPIWIVMHTAAKNVLIMLLLLLLLSRFSRVRLCATPETAAHQASPSLGFSRQEHWSWLPFLSPMHESEKWKWSHSVMSDSSDPMDCSPPGSSSTGFSRQKYWSGVPLPSPFNDDKHG